jgi:uroporphyrinogen decarboxylase
MFNFNQNAKISQAAKKIRDFYAIKPDAGIIQTEFGFFCLDKWKSQGYITDNTNLSELFMYEDTANAWLNGLGGCEAAFCPYFENKVLEDRGDYELVQDSAGRHVLYFKNRRNGFMPEYVDHPVKDMKSWEENCKWRMNPNSPERYVDLEKNLQSTIKRADEGCVIQQYSVGGYMYLRSLMGPEGVLYKFYDEPELIHDCMKTWFDLADRVTAEHQKYVTVDELLLDEDICYKCGPLISPDMMKEFIFPYYQQLINNIKSRQIDKSRHLFVHVATDGFVYPVIDLYREIGMDLMSPFEVAAGCDVVEVGKKYPDLLIRGGIDKRILAAGKGAIDREIARIMPVMKRRGGYIPTCDHGVPEEVDFNDYLHYRKSMQEFKD